MGVCLEILPANVAVALVAAHVLNDVAPGGHLLFLELSLVDVDAVRVLVDIFDSRGDTACYGRYTIANDSAVEYSQVAH